MFKLRRQRPNFVEKIPNLWRGRHIVIDGMVCTISRVYWTDHRSPDRDGSQLEATRVRIHADVLAPLSEFMEEHGDDLPTAA